MRPTSLLLLTAGLACGAAGCDPKPRAPATSPVPVEPDPKIEVELLTSSDELSAAGSIWLGIRFTIEPGWHIYWENPGDAGIATKAQLEVVGSAADGVTFGPVQYPGPNRYEAAGDIVTYGYEGEVILLVEARRAVDPPADASAPATDLTIAADTRWLGCSDQRCVPGRQRVELRLSASAPEPALLETARSLLPHAVNEPTERLVTTWTGPPDAPVLRVAVRDRTAEFFPRRGLRVTRQQFTPTDDGGELTVTLARDPEDVAPAAAGTPAAGTPAAGTPAAGTPAGVLRLGPSRYVTLRAPDPAEEG